jgi:polar amino acid transport system substrate-binding protein
MKIIKLIALISAMLFSFQSFAENHDNSLDHYKIMTDNYPPYNFGKGKDLQGISVEIYELILKELHSKLSKKDIEVLGWAKAYHTLQKNKHAMLFSTTKTEDRTNMFKWVGPIVPVKISLIAEKSKKIQINSLKELEKYKIGVVRSDVGEELLLNAHVPKKHLTAVTDIEHNIKKLSSGRIDLISYDEEAFEYALKEHEGEHPDKYETVYVLAETDVYFAFNKHAPDELIAKVQAAFDKVKESKSYDQILKKYSN